MNLNYQQLGAFLVPWPKYDERKMISECLHAISGEIDSNEVELHKLSEIKTALKSALLTGRVPVPENMSAGA